MSEQGEFEQEQQQQQTQKPFQRPHHQLSKSTTLFTFDTQPQQQQQQQKDFIRGKKRGLSFLDLTKKINENLIKIPIQQIKVMATKMSQVSKVMKTSKGRDKICQLVQYSSDLSYSCSKHSSLAYVQYGFLERISKGPQIAYNVKHSIKNGRKIFKLLNFLLEFKRLNFVLEKRKPLLYKMALALCRVANFFYYFFDNVLWATKIGKFSNLISGKSPQQLRLAKDIFCFSKILLKLGILIYKKDKRSSKIKTLTLKTGGKANRLIEQNDKYFYVCKYFLNQRIKYREDKIKIIVKVLQFLMVARRLRIFPFTRLIGDVAYATLGLCATILSTAKNLSEKQKLVKFQNENNPSMNPNKASMMLSSPLDSSLASGLDLRGKSKSNY